MRSGISGVGSGIRGVESGTRGVESGIRGVGLGLCRIGIFKGKNRVIDKACVVRVGKLKNCQNTNSDKIL